MYMQGSLNHAIPASPRRTESDQPVAGTVWLCKTAQLPVRPQPPLIDQNGTVGHLNHIISPGSGPNQFFLLY